MNMALTLVLIGNLICTSYRSVRSQTDSSPWNTSTGERVSPDGVAVSQDLLCPVCKKLHARCSHPVDNKLHYGDWVYIKFVGLKRVNDVMNARYKNRMDVWVASLDEEKRFYKRYDHTKLEVFKVREE